MKRFLFSVLIILLVLVSPVASAPNLVNHSQSFYSANGWTINDITANNNITTAPDGTVRAVDLHETGTLHYISHALSQNVVSGTNYTVSLYAKRNTSSSTRYVQLPLSITTFGSTNYTNFDLETCSVSYASSNPIVSAESVGSGWCRIRATSKTISSGASAFAFAFIASPANSRMPSYTGNVDNSTYIFGAQVEVGDTLSTYNATNSYPVGDLTASTYTGIAPQTVTLTDTSTPSEIISHAWYAINQSNSSPEYAVGTSQNQQYVFGEGNWTVKVKASNYLYSGNSSSKWVNVSSEVNVYPITDPINKTHSQYLPSTAITITPNTQVNLTAAKGEYESASFVLKGSESISGINISTPTLTYGGNSIPASAIDIKILVPSWNVVNIDSVSSDNHTPYSNAPYPCSGRWLSNENLWHNETKFARNDAACSNYLLVRLADGSEAYQNMSSFTDNIPETAVYDDSSTIQPFTINASLNKQFWITANISSTQATGNYSGVMSLTKPDGTYLKNITLNVRIRNFTLVDSTKQYSVYAHGLLGRSLDTTRIKTSYYNQTAAVYATYIADMRKNGVTHPILYVPNWVLNDADNATLEIQLTALNQSGLPKDAVHFIGGWNYLMGNVTSSSDITARVNSMNYYKSRATYYGFGKTYFYGMDEVVEPTLSSQRPVWTSVRLNGSYTIVAGYAIAYGADQFINVADILDTANIYGGYDHGYNTTLADALHAYGHKALIYAYPESGLPNPELYRRNYGFKLFNATYDGVGIYAWQKAYNESWNHFDISNITDEQFTLPTSNGSVYTLGLQGFREAADDNRYVATLISQDGNSNNANASVFSNISIGRLLPDIREQIANQIEYDILNPPDIYPPESITNLTSSSITEDHATLTWTNPPDVDYYRLIWWVSGDEQTPIDNETASTVLTGLPSDTVILVNTTTEDLNGNQNTTHWQNISFTSATYTAPTGTLWSNGTIDANRLLLRNPTSSPAGTSFTDLRNGTGTAIFETLTSIRAGATYANTTLTTGSYADYHYRTEVSIASPVPAGVTVDTATFGMYFNSSDISMGSVYTCLLDSTTTGSAWGAGDYQNTTFLKYSDTCKTGDAVNDKVTWDLNAAAIANISDQRFTMMLDDNKMQEGRVINYSWVAGGSSKVWWQTGDVFPALAPFYNISYHVADTPPGSGLPNPTSHWAFNEGSGTNADDPFGARDGTISGATWDSNGYSGNCLSFDGGDYVTMTNTSSYNFAGDYTVSIWVNSSQEQGNNVDILSNGEVLLRHTAYAIRREGDVYFLQNTVGTPAGSDFTGYGSTIAEYEIPENKWTNIIAVMSSNTMKIYINGVKDRDCYYCLSSPTNTYDTSVSGYSREGLSSLVIGNGFVGAIDEVKIWNIALTEDQIKSAYNHKPLILEKGWVDTIGKPLSDTYATTNDQTIHEGQRLMFEVIAKDIYWTNYTFSMTSGPTGATFTESPYYYAPYYKGEIGLFCWTPSYGQVGTYTPCLYVTNATSGVSDHICVTITAKKNYMLDPSSCASGYNITGEGDCVPTLKTNYGHEANPSSNPVGGGVGYGQIYTTGTYRVGDLNQLLWALSHATSGEVIYVLPNSTIDVSKQHQLSVPAGVTIASDRGHAGSLGALIYMNYNSTSINHALYSIFRTAGDNIRFTGLRLQGPDTSMRYEQANFLDGDSYTAYLPNDIIIYQRDTDSGLTVDNCEVYGWGEAAIYPAESSTAAFRTLNVSYNYIHHQQRWGGGYGVWANLKTTTTLEGNIFNWGRHYIAGSRGQVDYWANYNIIGDRASGYQLDNHGGNDVSDPSKPAGRNMTVLYNTIYPMGGDYSAHGMRGVPSGWSFDKYNWAKAVPSSDNTSAKLFYEGVNNLGGGYSQGTYYNVTVSNNYINLTRPTSIGALTADTSTGGQITFHFVNPSGSATNNTKIYKNGVYQYNVTNSTTSVVFSGLSAGDYTISTLTCSIGPGNTAALCGDSPWYNLTATATDAGASSNLLIILHYLWQFFHIGAWLK